MPPWRPAQQRKQSVEHMQRLDQPRHRVHRNARAEYRHHRKRAGIQRARLFIEAQAQKLRHRARLRAVIKRHHEDAHKDHGRNRADAVEVRSLQAILGARSAHADHFLRAEVGADKGQSANPRRQRAPRLEEVLAGLHVALEGKADAQHKHEIQQHDQPIDRREFQDLLLVPRPHPPTIGFRTPDNPRVQRCDYRRSTLLRRFASRPAENENVFIHRPSAIFPAPAAAVGAAATSPTPPNRAPDG